MTWEETVKYIRTKPEYKFLVEKSYLEEDLKLNVERFSESEEFIETLKLIEQYIPGCKTIADIGSGNGIAAIAFAKSGYQVTSVEPDASETVGTGAVRKIAAIYNLSNIKITNDVFEKCEVAQDFYDLVYIRQAMHHAFDLQLFLQKAYKILKKGGILLTVRDHVVYNEKDKISFLNNHPLQKFYEGENAYTLNQYIQVMSQAGFSILKALKHYDSVINYYPMTIQEFNNLVPFYKKKICNRLIGNKINIKIIENLIWQFYLLLKGDFPNEKNIPGRLYTFIARK